MKPPILIYGANKYLWGTISAIDAIKPQDNEGVDFQQDIDFLFAGTFKPGIVIFVILLILIQEVPLVRKSQ